MNLTKRIQKLMEGISVNIFEKEVIFKLCFLAMLSGESVFLLGKPGIAKSLIARRMKFSIRDGGIFEYLMNRFSTPEEIFGPISIQDLQEGRYVRLVKKYLPTANIGFLDEIWKAGPSILNNLLMILNEKIYRNGDIDIKVPLWLLISASNELPEKNRGLEALYDRFIIRYIAEPLTKKSNFDKMLRTTSELDIEVDPALQITPKEYNQWLQEVGKIQIDNVTLKFIDILRKNLKDATDNDAYISDRRWTKIIKLMKASAYYNGRNVIDKSDWLVIPYCIWDTVDQYKEYLQIFRKTFKDNLFLDFSLKQEDSQNEIKRISEEIKQIEKGMGSLVIYKDVFNGALLGDYFKINGLSNEYSICYIPKQDYFNLVDKPNDIIDVHLYLGPSPEKFRNTIKVKLKFISNGVLKILEKRKENLFLEKREERHEKNTLSELSTKLTNLYNDYENMKQNATKEFERLRKSSAIFLDNDLHLYLDEYYYENKIKKRFE